MLYSDIRSLLISVHKLSHLINLINTAFLYWEEELAKVFAFSFSVEVVVFHPNTSNSCWVLAVTLNTSVTIITELAPQSGRNNGIILESRPECLIVAKYFFLKGFDDYLLRTFKYTAASRLSWLWNYEIHNCDFYSLSHSPSESLTVHGLLFLELLSQLKMKIFSTGEISDDGRFTFEKYFVCLFQYLSYWESDKSDFFWHDIFL